MPITTPPLWPGWTKPMLTKEDAQQAPRPRFFCGVCNGEMAHTDEARAAHQCRHPVTGRQIDREAIVAARAKAAEKIPILDLLPPDCPDCHLPVERGVCHRCTGSTRKPDRGSLQALENANRLATLAHDLKILGLKAVKDDGAS